MKLGIGPLGIPPIFIGTGPGGGPGGAPIACGTNSLACKFQFPPLSAKPSQFAIARTAGGSLVMTTPYRLLEPKWLRTSRTIHDASYIFIDTQAVFKPT